MTLYKLDICLAAFDDECRLIQSSRSIPPNVHTYMEILRGTFSNATTLSSGGDECVCGQTAKVWNLFGKQSQSVISRDPTRLGDSQRGERGISTDVMPFGCTKLETENKTGGVKIAKK
ncbi:hypothetical protein BaRGS_00004746, partial [Batillaria attramentaria]